MKFKDTKFAEWLENHSAINKSVIAKEMGCSVHYLHDVIEGRRNISPNFAFKLCAALSQYGLKLGFWTFFPYENDGVLCAYNFADEAPEIIETKTGSGEIVQYKHVLNKAIFDVFDLYEFVKMSH